MKHEDRPGRRAFIRAGVAGGVALVTFPPGCGAGPMVLDGPIAGGNTADVPMGSLVLIQGGNVLLGHDAGGLYAMSAVCPHAGCTVWAPAVGDTDVNCPCHGSQFDLNGALKRGPAGRSLQHYHVDVAPDGAITIQGTQPVGSGERTTI
jgi:Rieske Fe-S protein